MTHLIDPATEGCELGLGARDPQAGSELLGERAGPRDPQR